MNESSISERSPGEARTPQLLALRDESGFGLLTLGADKLSIQALPSGCIYAIQHDQILINQVLASPLAGGIHRLYLRVFKSNQHIDFAEIVGPCASSTFAASADAFEWVGASHGLRYRCRLTAADSGWVVQVTVENLTRSAIRCDAIQLQDVGLATKGHVRNNELFTSQYLDQSVVQSDHGFVVTTRQNLGQAGERHPKLTLGCRPTGAKGFVTDGFDFFGTSYKATGVPEALKRPIIGTQVRQYESAYIGLQTSDVELPPRGTHSWTFFGEFDPDQSDAGASTETLQSSGSPLSAPAVSRSVFQTCSLLHTRDLTDADIDRLYPSRRHEERVNGKLHSFFHSDDSRHVVLRAKELASARPHGHIMRSGSGLSPDAELMSCTFYAAGVFGSQLTLGNTSLAKLLSTARDPLNIIRSSGLRILVRENEADDAKWQLLGVPSALEMAHDQIRWLYKTERRMITVTCRTSDSDPAMIYQVHVDGPPMPMLISGEIAAGPTEYDFSPVLTIDERQHRITVAPDPKSHVSERQPKLAFHLVTSTPHAIDAMGGDELLFLDREPRNLPYFAIRTRATTNFRFAFVGTIDDPERAVSLCEKYEKNEAAAPRDDKFWSSWTGGVCVRGETNPKLRERAEQIDDTLQWFARDALIHLATPRGLEQANGAAWGVRDVCQGPIEYLLSYDRADVVADILRVLFAQQYENRFDWPQWFMFAPYQQIQSPHAHGDVLIWPLKALCDYLEHTNDASILAEPLPYTNAESFEKTRLVETVFQHVDHLIDRMQSDFLPGVSLPCYGEGDWDDSLQPADPMLRERMVSSWTTQLMYQTLRRWADAMQHFGESSRADRAATLATAIEADFQKHLVPDGVVAGFALFNGGPRHAVEYLLHPSDTRTGLHYRLIPMTRGILAGIFTPQQAQRHVDLIHEHLLYPDGARLMDRPTVYQGGIERIFRRSESASFFGREIGLQYVHAHLRYAQAMAVMGRADELWRALLVVNPIAVTDVVKSARARQRNTYFSSSDAAFVDRYEASRDYEKLRTGEVPVDGGWRIYSSGPGLYTNMVIRHLLGLRRFYQWIEIDPVLPTELDGLTCELTQQDKRMIYNFSVRNRPVSERRILVNEKPIALSAASNPYRPGVMRVANDLWNRTTGKSLNDVRIEL